jgi:hypothetical protein
VTLGVSQGHGATEIWGRNGGGSGRRLTDEGVVAHCKGRDWYTLLIDTEGSVYKGHGRRGSGLWFRGHAMVAS